MSVFDTEVGATLVCHSWEGDVEWAGVNACLLELFNVRQIQNTFPASFELTEIKPVATCLVHKESILGVSWKQRSTSCYQ